MVEDFNCSIQLVGAFCYKCFYTILIWFIVCNNTLSGFNGVIESPNFPSVYPALVNCNWEIQVAEGNKINISFSHFNLEKATNSSSCTLYDYVEVIFASC